MSADGAVVNLPEQIKKDSTPQSQSQDTLPEAYSSNYIWYVISLLAVVNAINYMDRMALSVLLPAIKADLELSDGQLGLLVGLAFSVFYAVCGIPIARWADRGNRRNIITLALVVWSAMTALSGAAQNFIHLFLARIGVGAGEAGCIPPSQSMISDYVPLQRRSGAHAFHTFGIVFGMMLGMTLAGWLGDSIGWRWTFVVLGIPGVIVAIVVRLTLREPPRGYSDGHNLGASTQSLAEVVTFLKSCKSYVLLMLFFATNGFLQYGLNQWLPSFYGRSFGMELTSIGLYLGLALGGGGGVGLLLGGILANSVAKHNPMLPLIIGAVATAFAVPVALAILWVSSSTMSLWLVAVLALLWSVSNGPVIAAAQSVVLPQMRATASAIIIFFTSVIGFGLGPICVGVVSDLLTPTFATESLRYALMVPIALLPIMAILLWLSARQLPHDLISHVNNV